MKTHSKKRFVVKGILFGIAAAFTFTALVMVLWNWLMPTLFNLTEISFWQAMGLLVLSKVLLGSSHGHSHFSRYNRDKYWKERFKEKIDFARMHHGKYVKPVAENEQ